MAENVFLEEKKALIEKLKKEVRKLTKDLASVKFAACTGSDPCDRSITESAVKDSARERNQKWKRMEVLAKLLPALEQWDGICPFCRDATVSLSQVDATSSLMCTECRIEVNQKNGGGSHV